jgi:tetratricopeptide (TPR) repeat protein
MGCHRRYCGAFLILVSAGALSVGSATPVQDSDRAEFQSELPAHSGSTAYARGVERLVAGDLAGAETAFRRALDQRPGDAGALLGLAEIEFRRNRLEAAGVLIRDAVGADPENAHVQTSLGRYLLGTGAFAEAEAALLRAVDLAPDLFRARIDLADLYATILGQPQAAMLHYEAAIRLQPGHAGAHYALGLLAAAHGDADRAKAMLTRAMHLSPMNAMPRIALAEMHLRKGMALQMDGRSDSARAAYLDAVALDPQQAMAYNNLAWMAAENGTDLEHALEWAQRAVELAPHEVAYRDTLGWVHRAAGRLEEAERVLQTAAAMPQAPPVVHYHLGRVYLDLQRTESAADAFSNALALDAEFVPAQRALAALAR